eukprot:9747543-Alexandrium_andersonii.AAC.1
MGHIFRRLRPPAGRGVLYLKDETGAVQAHPEQLDASLCEHWGKVYAGNGDPCEIAGHFMARYSDLLVALPEAN